MAFSTDSVAVRPITCAGPRFSNSNKPVVRQYPVAASQTIIKGDILELDGARRVVKSADNADLSTVNVVGVAANDKTTGGTISEEDQINVYDAFGNIFEANLVQDEINDSDLVNRANLAVGRPLAFANLAPAPTAGQWVIEDGVAVNDDAIGLSLAPTQVQNDVDGVGQVSEGGGTFTDVQIGDKIPRAGAHTGILNARVRFVFKTVHSSIAPPAGA